MTERSSEGPDFEATQLNFLEQKLQKQFKSLERRVDFALCQIQNEIQFGQGLLSKLFPSEILSRYAGRQVEAAVYGDVLIEKACKRGNVTLVNSLRLGNGTYAIRPIALYQWGNETRMVQFRTGNVWELGVEAKTRNAINSVATFQIGGVLFTYDNATLLEGAVPVNELSLSLSIGPVEQPVYDFEKSRTCLNRIEDQSYQTVQKHLENMQIYTKRDQEGMDWRGSRERIGVIPGGPNVGWTIFMTCLGFLSHIWSVIWTALCIFVVVKSCRSRRRRGD